MPGPPVQFSLCPKKRKTQIIRNGARKCNLKYGITKEIINQFTSIKFVTFHKNLQKNASISLLCQNFFQLIKR